MKYRIIRALDIAGLKVLEPIVRLCYAEEPAVQLRKIGLFICIPILTFVFFIAGWSYVGPRHKTKSGEVPGPNRVVEAWNGIVQFATRENQKGLDFKTAGEKRQATLKQVRSASEKVKQYSQASNDRFQMLDQERTKAIEEKVAPYLVAVASKEDEYRRITAQRQAALLAKANAIGASDLDGKTAFLALIQDHLDANKKQTNHLQSMRAEINEMRQEKWAELENERKRKNALDQTKQFLQKRETQLSSGNRSVRVENLTRDITKDKRAFVAATAPDEMLALGTKIVRANARLNKIAASEYAQPPTFFMQIRRSLACVFVGFLIATTIAIPVGVLCGLSDVFMAAMSPLISLFKPVSPIVWLPIVFIIIGGFNLPQLEGKFTFIGYPLDFSYLTTPAFLASAITVALCSLWPTLVNTALGVASIDKDHVNVARVLRLGFWQRLFKIVIPSALPLIFAGLRISLGVGWMVLIAAELLSSSPGLGKYVWDMFSNGSSETFAQMFVVVFVVGAIGLLLDRIMIVFQRLVSFDDAVTAL